MSAATPTVVMLVADWEARQREILREVVREELDRREARRHPLSAEECAGLYCKGSMARWRGLRHRYPAIDERARIGGASGSRTQRWDADRLAQVMCELGPSLRRRGPNRPKPAGAL